MFVKGSGGVLVQVCCASSLPAFVPFDLAALVVSGGFLRYTVVFQVFNWGFIKVLVGELLRCVCIMALVPTYLVCSLSFVYLSTSSTIMFSS